MDTTPSKEQPKGLPRLSFSKVIPEFQIAWDSTSMGAFKRCPRYYYYSIVVGWVPRDESVHLTFGLHYHHALEAYDHAKALGANHEQATRSATRTALSDSWDPLRKRPWFSDHKYKHRLSLVRSVVWYLDKFKEDPLETIILENKKPAVELSWRISLERTSNLTSEPLLLCGHLDRLVNWQNHVWVVDRKTSVYSVDESFFERFSPDNQFSTYSYAGKVIFSENTYGIICDAAQILMEGTRFQRGQVIRTPQQLEEWRTDLDWYLDLAEHCAKTGYWPQNDQACGLYGGCPYRSICGKSPGVRSDWLKASFHKRIWDPLQVRGEI